MGTTLFFMKWYIPNKKYTKPWCQSTHNMRWDDQKFKLREVFFGNRNKKIWNPTVFRKTVLGNLVKTIYTEWQNHWKGKNILKHLPKFAWCEIRQKNSKSKQAFKVKNRKKKLEVNNFSNSSTVEPYKEALC